MNLFDKICAVPTIAVGAIFMALGGFGLVFGCNAHFTLPPILGGLPFFLGWGMCVVLIKYWRLSARLKQSDRWQGPSDSYSPPGAPQQPSQTSFKQSQHGKPRWED